MTNDVLERPDTLDETTRSPNWSDQHMDKKMNV
jgi:hypothetical protein